MRRLLIILYRFKFLKRIVPSIFKICIKIFNINNVTIKHKKSLFLLNLKNPIDREIYLKNKYEKKQLNYLIKFIKKKNVSIFLDIGAHMGFYSINLSRIVKNIYAFEPSPNNYSQLKQNVSINKIRNIKVFNKALSNVTKNKIKMWVPDKNRTGGFSIPDSNDHELKKYNSNKIFSIISSCEKLDIY
jgi:FkbM family methyltransferase